MFLVASLKNPSVFTTMNWLKIEDNLVEIRYPQFGEVFPNLATHDERLESSELWDAFLDGLDCYGSCETLTIETDFIHDIPSNVKKFTKLRTSTQRSPVIFLSTIKSHLSVSCLNLVL